MTCGKGFPSSSAPRRNIQSHDHHSGGEGTAEFAHQAIEVYCK